MTSDRQRQALAEVTAAFVEYRQVVAEERELMGRGQRAQALRLVDGEGAVRAERVDALAAIASLRETDATTQAALREAAGLEQRTWTVGHRGTGRCGGPGPRREAAS